MGKLKQVSADEISATIDAVDNLNTQLDELADRIEKGYMHMDDFAVYDEEITALTVLAKNTIRLSLDLHTKARMVRHTAAMEQRLRQKA